MEATIFTSVPLQTLVETITAAVVKTLESAPLNSKNEKLLTRQQTAKILQVSLPTLNNWTKKGIIKANRINSRVRYREEDVYLALENYNKYDCKI